MSAGTFITAFDGRPLYVRHWEAGETAPVIQLAHGLGETADYYEEFAQAAVRRGFDVYANEARGHGRTAGDAASPDYRGGDAGEDGLNRMADDLFALTRRIRMERPHAPVFLLGHSMGAVIAQLYVRAHGETLAGLALSGTPYVPLVDELLQTAEDEIAEAGPGAPSVRTFARMFAGVNDAFAPAPTGLEWITGDEAKIREFLALPYTNIAFNNAFYRDFLRAVRDTQDSGFWNGVPRALPMLLLAGGRDAVGDNGEASHRMCARLRADGFAVSCKVYAGLRHSILQETGRVQVTADLLDWFASIVEKRG